MKYLKAAATFAADMATVTMLLAAIVIPPYMAGRHAPDTTMSVMWWVGAVAIGVGAVAGLCWMTGVVEKEGK